MTAWLITHSTPLHLISPLSLLLCSAEHDASSTRNGAKILSRLNAVHADVKDVAANSDAKLSFLVETAESSVTTAVAAPLISSPPLIADSTTDSSTASLLSQIVSELKSLKSLHTQQHAELLAAQAKQHAELIAALRDIALSKK